MEFTTTRNLLCEVVFAVLLLVGIVPNVAVAANEPKVQVCHIPPGNPANFHTITISPNALEAHLAHGDIPGACSASCAVLCDDGNACTIDDTGDCETKGCPTVHPLVDCSDDNLCTTDICDPGSGCINSEARCSSPDLTCNPATGICE